MSVNIYDSTTDTLHKVAGLVDDTDLKQDIEDIQAVIPSGASSSNQLATVKGSVDHLMPQAPWVEDNFNNAKINDTGVAEFTVLNSATNTPATGANYVVIYTGFSATLGRQVAIQNGNTATYTRSRTGADTWSAWQKLFTNSDLTSLSTSTPSSTNKLVTQSSEYKIQTRSWNMVGNRYMKLSNMFTSSAGLMTTIYLVSSRNGEAYLMICGNSDGSAKSTPQVIKLQTGTGKLGTNGFYWDADTSEIAIMTQGYNIVQVTQIAGERTDFTIGDLSTSNPLTTPTALTVTSLVPTSTVTSGSIDPIQAGAFYPTAIATPTPVSGVIIDASTCYGYKSGKTVTLILNGITLANDIAENNPIASGLPMTMGNKNVYFCVYEYNTKVIQPMSIIGTNLDAGAGGCKAGRYWGTATYMTSD